MTKKTPWLTLVGLSAALVTFLAVLPLAAGALVQRQLLRPQVQTFVLAGSAEWPSTVAPLARQVPRIETIAPDMKGPATCSGVVIAPEYVLTAAHCLLLGKTNVSLTVNGRHADVVRQNQLLDLAVLRFTPKNELVMPLAPKNADPGTEIAAAGYLLAAKELRIQFGNVAGYDGNDMMTTVQVLPGDSGGPMFNKDGQLVGITTAYYQGTSISFAVPIETVRGFIEPYAR